MPVSSLSWLMTGGPVAEGRSPADGLAEFFAARLDEDEAEAEYAQQRLSACGGVHVSDPGDRGDIGHLVAYTMHAHRHNPARVLREIEADRALLAKLRQVEELGKRVRADTEILLLRQVVAIRATIWNAHPDYKGWIQ